MSINQKNLKSLGGLILNGGAHILLGYATGGLLPVTSVVGEFVKSITGSLASNHFSKLSDSGINLLEERFKSNNPDDINHDLERIFRNSSIVALRYIEEMFLNRINKIGVYELLNENEKISLRKNIKNFFKNNRSKLSENVKKEERSPLDKAIIESPEKYLDSIIDFIFQFASIDLDVEIELELKKFYKKNLPYCFDLAFKEALKNDDLGFKAFQIWKLEELQSQNNILLKGQKDISVLINKLRDGNEYLIKEREEEKWDVITNNIYNILEEQFTEIKNSLINLSKFINKDFEQITYKIDKIDETTSDTNEKIFILDKKTDKANAKLDILVDNIQRPHPIEKVLGANPASYTTLIGREQELITIREKFLNTTGIIPLSGDGGIGKSSLARAYYARYIDDYEYVIWKYNVENIGESLLSLSTQLKIEFKKNLKREERLELLIRKLKSLQKPCLLIIDNVNSKVDVTNNGHYLTKLINFHVLVTTRLRVFNSVEVHKLEPLSVELALELFKKHYSNHSESDNELFYKLYERIGGNTLVIELLSKQLNSLNQFEVTYSLLQMLEELESRGVFLLTQQTKIDNINYQSLDGKMREETIENIIDAMYQLSDLTDEQINVLTAFALLPSESISFSNIKLLLSKIKGLKDILKNLDEEGWIEYNKNEFSFNMNPIIRDTVLKNNEKLWDISSILICELFNQIGWGLINSEAFWRSSIINLQYTFDEFYNLKIKSDQKKIYGKNYFLGYFIGNYSKYNYTLLEIKDYLKEIKREIEDLLPKKGFDDKYNLSDDINVEDYTASEQILVKFYLEWLEKKAEVEVGLGFLRSADKNYNKARNFAAQLGFEFNEYGFNRYLIEAGRLMEAEPYFLSEYKKDKTLFEYISRNLSENDLRKRYGIENTYQELKKKLEEEKLNVAIWIVLSSSDLANIFLIQGRYEEAKYFRKRCAEFNVIMKHNNQDLYSAIINRGLAMTLIRDYESLDYAEDLLINSLKIFKRVYGSDDNFDSGKCFMELFQIKLKTDSEIRGSIKFYDNAKKIFRLNLGEDSRLSIEMDINFYKFLSIKKKDNLEKLPSKKKLEDYFIKVFEYDLEFTLDKFGIYHPVLHEGLELTSQVLKDRGEMERCKSLELNRIEYVRILESRTLIRTQGLKTLKIRNDSEKKQVIKRIKAITSLPMDSSQFELKIIELPFYKTYDLCQINFLNTSIKAYKYVLLSENNAINHVTTNHEIYRLGKNDLNLNKQNVLNYVTFFFDSVVGRHGKFYIINDYIDIPWMLNKETDKRFKDVLMKVIYPIKHVSLDENKYILKCFMFFIDSLFESKVNVNIIDGTLNLFDEEQIYIDISKKEFVAVKDRDIASYKIKNVGCKLVGIVDACIDSIY